MVRHCRRAADHVRLSVYQAREQTSTNIQHDLVIRRHPHRDHNRDLNATNTAGLPTGTAHLSGIELPDIVGAQATDGFGWDDVDGDVDGISERDNERLEQQRSVCSEPYFGAGNTFIAFINV
jgi:hypothetical protein